MPITNSFNPTPPAGCKNERMTEKVLDRVDRAIKDAQKDALTEVYIPKGIRNIKDTEKMNAENQGIRTEVKAFAEIMEQKLKENDHKHHWSDSDNSWLLERLLEEVKELESIMDSLSTSDEEKQRECADIANFAMMIADNIQKLSLPSQQSPVSEVEINRVYEKALNAVHVCKSANHSHTIPRKEIRESLTQLKDWLLTRLQPKDQQGEEKKEVDCKWCNDTGWKNSTERCICSRS